MLYAQFYQFGVISGALIEACSDRAVVIYDGRLRLADVLADAKVEAAKRGYVAMALFKGRSFNDARRISEIFPTVGKEG
jgi:hypothetical protein